MGYLENNHLLVIRVWQKGAIVPTHDPSRYRKDRFGNWIALDEYGLRSAYGWEIDHIFPTSLGGGDHLDNLQPLHWRSNAQKGNRFVG
jgi:5-methylcytosine-specific restriction endonuclease McrA